MRTIVRLAALFFLFVSAYVCAGDLPPPGGAPGEESSIPSSSSELKGTPTPIPKVYKWVDDKGVTHYADQPQTEGAAPVNLPTLQVMDSIEAKAVPSSTAGSPNQITTTTEPPTDQPIVVEDPSEESNDKRHENEQLKKNSY